MFKSDHKNLFGDEGLQISEEINMNMKGNSKLGVKNLKTKSDSKVRIVRENFSDFSHNPLLLRITLAPARRQPGPSPLPLPLRAAPERMLPSRSSLTLSSPGLSGSQIKPGIWTADYSATPWIAGESRASVEPLSPAEQKPQSVGDRAAQAPPPP